MNKVEWTAAEAEAHAQKNDRECVLVYEEGDGGFTAYYADGEGGWLKFRHTNPFGLDSLLSEAGVPAPRNLYLITEEEN